MNVLERDRLREIKTFPSLIKYLREELDWPIETDDFDDLTFDYEPEELGIDSSLAAKIETIKQLRPLVSNQPWGIFFVKFEPKRLPVVVLRRILRSLVIKKRTSERGAQQAAWQRHDLLFISSYGEQSDRHITFAHFADPPQNLISDLPTLKVLGWDDADTALHLEHVHLELHEKLHWPEDENDLNIWRNQWASAFTLRHREVITTSRQLAIKLADLARSIRKRVDAVLAVESKNGPIRKLMNAFKEALIHDLSEDDFADMYAQTIAYGLLSARVSRPAGLVADNVADMVPITNPFLKELLETFLQIGGRRNGKGKMPRIDFDELGINDVVELLREVNMEAVLRDFGRQKPEEDPVIHFYELFLKEYDAKKRIQRGVFFTPTPVVSFIVRSVDEILRAEFGLKDGLADTTTWGEMSKHHSGLKIPEGVAHDLPFVQILDPATGTATFLVEVIDVIHKHLKTKWNKVGLAEMPRLPKGAFPIRPAEFTAYWNQYVATSLLPRLYGYELMMAPYAIAHMKIGLKLYETGYRFGSDERARIYLTNSLEPPQDFSDRLAFDAPALAHEAQAVNAIKRRQHFTVVMGNPPYSNFGQLNRIPFILRLLDDYKRGLDERKINIDDDFIKFIRFCQWKLSGDHPSILGLITNNSYIDGLTHRRMRESLLQSFQNIRIIDLHGNISAKEISPDGSADENVFDIKQGVAISIMSKLNNRAGQAEVFNTDIFGSRESKYKTLMVHIPLIERLDHLPKVTIPNFFFTPRRLDYKEEYETGFALNDCGLMLAYGIQTKQDALFVSFSKGELEDRLRAVLKDMHILGPEKTTRKYGLGNSSGWSAERLIGLHYDSTKIRQILYRPFDVRWIYYDPQALGRARFETLRHMLVDNVGLIVMR